MLRTDYIRFARARGLTDRAVHFGHALKNTLVPVITITGLQLGAIIAFAIITETVFQWPGMGLLFIQAVSFADVPVMAAYLCLIALFFVVINLAVDLLYYAVDPRLRTAAAHDQPRSSASAPITPSCATLRRDLHAHPELALRGEPHRRRWSPRSSPRWGIEVHTRPGEDRRRRRDPGQAQGERPRRSACAPTWTACRCTRRTSFAHKSQNDGPHARLRPRRPHHDAARRRALPRRDAQLRRHGLSHLPAGRGRRRRRPGDGEGRPVRALPGRRGLRAAQLARAAAGQDGRAPRPDDGGDRRDADHGARPRRPRRACRTSRSIRSSPPRTSSPRCRPSPAATSSPVDAVVVSICSMATSQVGVFNVIPDARASSSAPCAPSSPRRATSPSSG